MLLLATTVPELHEFDRHLADCAGCLSAVEKKKDGLACVYGLLLLIVIRNATRKASEGMCN